MTKEVWAGCYDQSWHGYIVDDAFAHPAKMSRALLTRIYDRLFEMGALMKGDRVVDPFGGIGTTGIIGATKGIHVICHELEPKFVELARQNFDKHCGDWVAMGWPLPMIVQGDSRKLSRLFRGVEAVIASPPYAEIASGAGGLNTLPAAPGQQGGRSAASPSQDTDQRYGDQDGQLAKMPIGNVDAIVSSPPFTQGYSGGGGINVKGYGDGSDKVGERTYQALAGEREPGNLETMPLGHVDDENTGTFWAAAFDIVRECYTILKIGGVAVFVTKHFVRNGKLVDFPGDWRKLCEHTGFETILEVQASLVTEEVHIDLLDGREVTTRRERKSFFRRLAEKKGSPRIDFETVHFLVKR